MSTKRTLAVLLAAISLLFSSCAGESPDVTADESTSDERISEEITTDEITTDDSETTKTETTEPASDTTAAALTEDDIRSAIEKNLDVIAPTDSELVSENDAIAAHPEEFDRIVALGADALPYLSEIGNRYESVGSDTSGNLRCFVAKAAEYAIDPEKYDITVMSPDGKYAVKATVKSFSGLADPFSGIEYYLRLVDNVTGDAVADAGENMGFTFLWDDISEFTHWSDDCRSVVIEQRYRHYYSSCYLFTVGKTGVVKLPTSSATEQLSGVKLVWNVDGSDLDFTHFQFDEWSDDSMVRVRIYVSDNAGWYEDAGWYTYDIQKESIKKLYCEVNGVSEGETVFVCPDADTKITALYPVISGESAGTINTQIREYVRRLYAERIDSDSTAEQDSLTAEVRYETTRMDEDILSVRFIGQNSGGGTAQSVSETGLTFDMKTGELLPLSELYTAEDVSAMIDAYFDAFDESEYPTLSGLHTPDELRADFYRQFGGSEPEYHSYYLRDGKLCLIAGQYEDYMSDTDSWAHGRRPFVMETDTGKSK